MKKEIFTLNVNYSKEITDLTYPLIELYAKKIGAKFTIISDRKFPGYDLEYEKLQIHTLGKKNDWNIYIDSDAVVHPDTFDITSHLNKDTVLHHGIDKSDTRWTLDEFFLRDGRNIASCNWFTVGSNWCLDLWRPPDDLTEKQAVSRIFPTSYEKLCGIQPKHLVSDYILSRNIARYGLKVTTFLDLLKKTDRQTDNYFWHVYTVPLEEKIKGIKEVLTNWKINMIR